MFGGREGEAEGLVEALVQEELGRNSTEWVELRDLRFKVLLGLCNHWPFLG